MITNDVPLATPASIVRTSSSSRQRAGRTYGLRLASSTRWHETVRRRCAARRAGALERGALGDGRKSDEIDSVTLQGQGEQNPRSSSARRLTETRTDTTVRGGEEQSEAERVASGGRAGTSPCTVVAQLRMEPLSHEVFHLGHLVAGWKWRPRRPPASIWTSLTFGNRNVSSPLQSVRGSSSLSSSMANDERRPAGHPIFSCSIQTKEQMSSVVDARTDSEASDRQFTVRQRTLW